MLLYYNRWQMIAVTVPGHPVILFLSPPSLFLQQDPPDQQLFCSKALMHPRWVLLVSPDRTLVARCFMKIFHSHLAFIHWAKLIIWKSIFTHMELKPTARQQETWKWPIIMHWCKCPCKPIVGELFSKIQPDRFFIHQILSSHFFLIHENKLSMYETRISQTFSIFSSFSSFISFNKYSLWSFFLCFSSLQKISALALKTTENI